MARYEFNVSNYQLYLIIYIYMQRIRSKHVTTCGEASIEFVNAPKRVPENKSISARVLVLWICVLLLCFSCSGMPSGMPPSTIT